MESQKIVEEPRSYFSGRLRSYFLAGILVTAPLGITVYIAYLFISYVDTRVSNLIPAAYHPDQYLPFSVPGLGLVVVVVSLILIGWLTAGLIGRLFIRISDRIMARVPFVRSIYMVLKQILETVVAQQTSSFREVVLVEYPRKGIWSIGFVTGTTRGEVQNVTADEMVNVFLPTTPNPTSGFLLFIPRKDLYVMNMPVEEGIKMVISAGIVTPPDRRPDEIKKQTVITTSDSDAA